MFIKKELVGKAKKTVLIATHDLAEAEEICDTVAIMHKGRLLIKEDTGAYTGKKSLKELFLELTENVTTP